MLTIKRLPGNRGSFIAKTEKKTRMFVYQVSGKAEDIDRYLQAKQAEGYEAIVDAEFGTLFFTSINLGRQAELGVTDEGKIWANNLKINEAKELKGQVSDATIDKLIIEAMAAGSYATPVVTVTANTGNLNP